MHLVGLLKEVPCFALGSVRSTCAFAVRHAQPLRQLAALSPSSLQVLHCRELGINAIVVMEQYSELEMLLNEARRLGVRPAIGIRAKLTTRHNGHWGSTSGGGGWRMPLCAALGTRMLGGTGVAYFESLRKNGLGLWRGGRCALGDAAVQKGVQGRMGLIEVEGG